VSSASKSSHSGSGEGGRGEGRRGRGDSRRGGDSGRGGESGRGDLIDKVIKIKRCAAVVKGGRRFSFAAMVVVGNGKGKVGWGYGKANEVPPSVEKAVKDASRSLIEIPIEGGTIPHPVKGHYGAGSVVLVPASPGTGLIAGAAVRSVCEAAGIHDLLTKCYGSTNPVNLVKATIDALTQLRTRHEVERLRGVSLA
jgi:small subunit ribosomal protein S5